MKSRVLSISLAVILILSVGLIGCGGEQTPEYSLTVSSTEGGLVTTPGQGIFTYDEGTVVNLVAIAGSGYHFVNWIGDISAIGDINQASTAITMQGNYEIKANFEAGPYSLTISSTTGGSAITPGEGAFVYDAGTVVDLVAEADDGYMFATWTGDVSSIADVSSSSTTITMNGDYTISADFGIGIYDWYDLDDIRDNLDGSYILMNDLDSTIAGYAELAGPTANGGKGWQPIGGILVSSVGCEIVSAESFGGLLNGKGYEIRDMSINRPDQDGVGLFGAIDGIGILENLGVVNSEVVGHLYVGRLAGDNRGTLSNCHSAGSVTGWSNVGGLVGCNRDDGAVSSCYSAGSVTGDWYVGGLAGANYRTVSNSCSAGSVTGGMAVGGLVGWQGAGTVSDSYSTGSVTGNGPVGGLVAESHDTTVSNSYYNYDEVLINGRSIITIGALSNQDFEQWLANDKSLHVSERFSQEDGYYLINGVNDFKSLLAFGQDSAARFRLTNDLDLAREPNFYIPYLAGEFDGDGHKIANLSFSFDFISEVGSFGYLASGGAVTGVGVENVNITGQWIVGGLVGENDGTVTNSYSTGSVTGYRCVGGLVGSMGLHAGTVSNSYYSYEDVLINGRSIITIGALFDEDFDQWLANDKFLDITERLSQEDGYYLINGVNDFKSLLAFGQNGALKFRLTNDLDLGGNPDFYIPYLAGEFDGDGHKIWNLNCHLDVGGQVGLFGYLVFCGKVSEVGVENIDVTVTGPCDHQVGGLVGCSFGTVSNSYSTGSVTGSGDVGGLVGWNEGTVGNSYSTTSVTGRNVGGLVGWGRGGTVSNSYSTGSVTGIEYVGGLVGIEGGIVSHSFWDTETSGQTTSGGGIGKNTAEMQDTTTFSRAGWNIVAVGSLGERNTAYIWDIVDGQTYPFLSWQS